MSVVTPFSRESVQALAADIQVALDEVAKKHGIVIQMKPGKFSETTYFGQFEATLNQSDKAALADADRDYYNLVAPKLGIDIAKFPFGKVIDYGRDKYQITGLFPNSKKNPIKVMRVRDRKDGFGLPLYAVVEPGKHVLPEVPI